MECKIFYSWQSDLPNPTNRGFIQAALEIAAKSIRDDNTIQIEPVIDRDTTGVPGAPDIANTILSKIEKSQIFVADVSIINNSDISRKVPNPNVLIELGYAIRTLGLERIIIVMNTAYGNPELLPFDLRMRRTITYNMPDNEKDRSSERKRLSSILENGIRSIISNLEQQEAQLPLLPPFIDQVINAIFSSQPNQEQMIRKYMESVKTNYWNLHQNFLE